MTVIVFGLPGSGKSFFAKRLSTFINGAYINSDEVRQQFLPTKTYSEEEKLLVYEEIRNRVKLFLQQGIIAVVDATFYKDDLRKKFIQEANMSGIIFIEVIADESTVRERLKTPRAESDADFEVYKKIRAQWEPMKQPHLALKSTNTNIDEMLHKAVDYLNLYNECSTGT